MNSEQNKKSYTGFNRVPLAVGNPLLKDISLIYCGLKKVPPKKREEPQKQRSEGNIQNSLKKALISKLL